MKIKELDKINGCLIGGAIGDALGFPIEFLSYKEIQKRYGNSGLNSYIKNSWSRVAEISDDTQMTMFTTAGIICSKKNAIPLNESIFNSYLNWLTTQDNKKSVPVSWLYNVKVLYSLRTPGSTCLSALRSGNMGNIEEPLNDSKGCGGIMRVAPIGLYDANSEKEDKETLLEGAKVAAITHGNPMGYIPAGILSLTIRKIAEGKEIETAIKVASKESKKIFYETEYDDKINKVIEMAKKSKETDICNITSIGEGWKGDEALLIAIYCAVKYNNNFSKAILTSINHSGDSDSIGSICGNMIGAKLGLNKINKKWKNSLELYDEICELGKDLYNAKQNNIDDNKYY